MRKLEAVLLGVGLTLLAIFVGFRIHSVVGRRAALRQFAARSAVPVNSGAALQAQDQPDFRLWSGERIKEYHQSRTVALDEPLAVLTIPRIASHRNGPFRCLKDVQIGDRIELGVIIGTQVPRLSVTRHSPKLRAGPEGGSARRSGCWFL